MAQQAILIIGISAFLFMVFYLFPIKRLKTIFFRSTPYHKSNEKYIPKNKSVKKYFHLTIEILISFFSLYLVNPMVELIYVQKYLKIKGKNPNIFELDYFYPTSRRLEDKIILYVCFLVIIIGYQVFKYTMKIVAKNRNNITVLSNIIRLRILILAFVFLACFFSLLPISDSLPDFVLGGILSFSFLPLILIFISVSSVGIINDINIQQHLKDALGVFFTLPILCWAAYSFGVEFLGTSNIHIIKYIFMPFFIFILYKFKSIRNLDDNTKKLDKYFK